MGRSPTVVLALALGLSGSLSSQSAWVRLTSPPPRSGDPVVVWQSHSGSPLLFASSNQRSLTRTLFEWDGFAWRDRTPPISPANRDDAALAYMPWSRRTLLFGGFRVGRTLRDTWEWDGSAWTERTVSTGGPAGLVGHAMAADPIRREVVLFGGVADSNGALDDTWVWSGGVWSRRRPRTVPPPRSQHAMVWDPVRGRILLQGGVGLSGSLTDTWEWDGRNWLEKRPAHAPPPYGSGLAMTFDLRRNRVVAIHSPNLQVWEWDGIDWAQRPTPSSLPPPRARGAVVYDLDSDRVLLFGGRRSPMEWVEDCWSWDPSTNTWSAMEGVPLAANNPQLVSLGAQGPLLLHVDGIDRLPGDRSTRTWTFDGSRWQRLRTPTVPSAGLDARLEVDPRDGTVWKLAQQARETWRFDGSDWSLFPTATVPTHRFYVGSAFDTGRGEWVTFGGSRVGGGFAVLDETWVFDGTDWAQRSVPGPPARQAPAMAYDPLRQVVVLYGGRGVGRLFGDTWEWDGQRWTRRFSSHTPEFSPEPQLLYDPDRRVVALCSHSTLQGGRLWEWDGVDWRMRRIAAYGNTVSQGSRFARDPLGRGLFLFGSEQATEVEQRHAWLLAENPASATAFGVACAGPAGAPRLQTTCRPSLGFGLRLDVVGAPPLSATAVALSLGRVDLPLGPCRLYYDPATRLFEQIYLADVHGSVRLPWTAPADRALVGVAVHGQAASLAHVPGGLVTSRGLRLVFGD